MAAKTAQMPEAFNMPTAANNNASLQISLPQLLDLAIGAPEVGAVNFNILHNFLHILLKQINLQATAVEFHGEKADRIKRMTISMKPSPEVMQRVRRDDGEDADVLTEDIQVPEEKILRVTEDLTAMERDVIKGDAGVVTADTSLINTRLDVLENKVSKMERWLNNLQGVTDMLIEDIAVPTTDITAVEEKEEAEAAIVEEKEAEAATVEEKEEAEAATVEEKEEAEPAETKDVIVSDREKKEKAKEVATKIRRVAPEKLAVRAGLMNTAIEEIRQDVTTLKTNVARIQQELQDLNKRVAPIVGAPLVEEKPGTPSVQEKPVVPSIQEKPVAPLVQEKPVAPSIQEKPVTPSVQEKPVAPLVQEIESVVREPIIDKEKIVKVTDVTNLEQCLEAVKNVETIHGEALNDITQRVVVLESEFRHLLEKVDSIQEADKTDDNKINNLITKVQEIETDMDKIGQTLSRLLEDKEKKEAHINMLLEQIEILKTVKANKEDIEDALADKADALTVNRKVSHDQFDAACDDLARGLEEAIDKLTKQESIWQQALDEVQNEIATKMDKVEMTPLKDFVNNKLKSLQEKLKIMIEARQEIEAAGTKKLLKDVQCISCDKDVVMKREEVGRFRAEPFPCTTSIKPYLTYELDQVRKQQKRLPHSRNLIQFEAAMQEEAKKMKAKEEILTKSPRYNLCNRYCGGSHTVTTPQQRVMRPGHFLTQWGPETVQLTDGLVRGKDGQMYRSRPVRGKPDVCGPSCWEGQIGEETGLSESSTVPRKPMRRNSAGNHKNGPSDN